MNSEQLRDLLDQVHSEPVKIESIRELGAEVQGWMNGATGPNS